MFAALRKLRYLAKRRAARKAREQAIDALRDAEARRDDREIGRARMVLAQATTEALRVGV